MRTIIIGTRQSELALTQANYILSMLENVCKQHQLSFRFELKKIVTKGDRILDVTLSKVGGKGLFVKEIEQAMLDKEIDVAVHSMKDMPAELREGLILAAITEREDPRDCLISRGHTPLSELRHGAKIGTSSLRRACQLKAHRPDLQIEFVRGNIGTRIGKIDSEGFDGVILATAGLNRVGWQDKISEHLSPELSLPAVGQGALGLECREEDKELRNLLAYLNHEVTAAEVTAERAFLARLNGGCQFPIAAYGTLTGKQDTNEQAEIRLEGLVGTPDGTTVLRQSLTGSEPVELGKKLADQLIDQGAGSILERFGGQ